MSKDDTTIVGDRGGELDKIKARINQIKAEVENTDSDFDREKLQEGLAKLAGGVAVVKVGAATETEIKERKHRVEDVFLPPPRAALEEGIVPGGGVAQVLIIPAVLAVEAEGDELTGVRIVARALEEPLRQLANNAGLEGSVVVNEVKTRTKGVGMNVATGEYEDIIQAGDDPPMRRCHRRCRHLRLVLGPTARSLRRSGCRRWKPRSRRADRVTMAGSMMPAWIDVPHSPVATFMPTPLVRVVTLIDNDRAFQAGVIGQLAQRFFQSAGHDANACQLVALGLLQPAPPG